MDNIIECRLDSTCKEIYTGIWQHDYGQILRITGVDLPKAVEVQFSLRDKGGDTLTRIGTTVDGVTEVKVPDSFLKNENCTQNYLIYAWIYVTDDASGNTEYQIILHVKSRPKPEEPSEEPLPEPNIFHETVEAVNASADRAEMAEQSAKESAASADEKLAEIKRVADGISGSIENANTMKSELSDLIDSAEEKKKELVASTKEAGETKTELDSSIKSAGEKQLALDATAERANTVDASLKEQIGSAEKIQENVEQIGKNKADISSLNEDLSNKITKFYASNQGETHLADSDNGKIMDMMLYGRSEQKQYKGINLFPPNTGYGEFVEVSIPKGTKVFAITDGTNFTGGNFRFFNADKTENMWFGVEKDTTMATYELKIDAKYVQNLINRDFDLSKVCLCIGNEPIYEPYVGGIPSPSPDYPQEIKRVVNPTMKVCGKNLWDNFKTLSLGNVEQKNGTYIATADNMQVDITMKSVGARPLLLKANNAYTFSLKTTVSISSPKFVCLRYTNGESNNIIFTNKNFVNFVPKRDVEKVGFILYESVAGDKVYDVQLEMGSEATSYEPYTEQSVQLPYTLNAIPVSSGGNVTIDGQQYIADYVDVERGKVVRKIGKLIITGKENWMLGFENWTTYPHAFRAEELKKDILKGNTMNAKYTWYQKQANLDLNSMNAPYNRCISVSDARFSSVNEFANELKKQDSNGTPLTVYYVTDTPKEENLSIEEIEFLKSLSTYYPVTNISVNSEQLDGYTVFNYPISMANGWNYVKQQLNDNRDYIYDMDIQSAEAYVNSEYAVALTELEV